MILLPSTAGTSFFHCFFAISSADFHQIREDESEKFKATLRAYKRRYIYVMLPVLAGVDLFLVQVVVRVASAVVRAAMKGMPSLVIRRLLRTGKD